MSKKILFIAPDFPYPLSYGTHLRIFDFLLNLSLRGYQTTLISLSPRPVLEESLRKARELCREVHLVPHPFFERGIRPALGRLWYRAKGELLGYRLDNESLCPRSLKETVRRITSRESFHAAIVSYTFLGGVSPHLDGLFTVLDTVDLFYKRYESLAKVLKDVRYVEYFNNKEEELEIVRKFNLVAAISREDAEILREHLPEKEIVVVPLSTEVLKKERDLQTKEAAPEEDSLLYVAGKDESNRAAISYFLKGIFPMVLEKVPSARLTILGGVCELLGSLHHGRVEKRGYVESLDGYYHAARVVVLPDVCGSGLRTKLIEALAYGKAVVTTPLGSRGVPLTSGVNAFLASSPEEFAQGVVTLLLNREKRKKVEEEARIFALTEFSPEKTYGEFFQLLDRVIG